MKVLDDEKDLLLDHEYDGIKELDNHMPGWWLWLFYFTIAWGVGYMVYYYMLGGPTQEELYEREMAAAEEQYDLESNDGAQPEAVSFDWAYLEDEERIAEGREIYMSNSNLCFTCHGSNGEGIVGPNLTDNMWIHGCSPEDVANSIIEGYPERGMLPYGSSTPLEPEKVQSLISFIASLQGSDPANAKAPDPNRAEPCSIE